ncbi:SDR family NAD(P)-dependent oxidoreductase [Kitasatospora sp. NPDC017646]|uniref:SDR family NAD(P)-dependent oxidoreductase n=1 Tax=Kitasatospora sp. NPDC017646 TaxID=3364024 RepID=UPI0037A839D9
MVTGGARGTGAARARRFAAEGAAVTTADVLREEGESLAAELGPPTTFHTLDVTSSSSTVARRPAA